jgi:transcriptional regulator with XRE-family HTH domain
MKNTFNVKVGGRIRSARKKQKMTMKELGKKVNLHESTISRYEKGEISTLDIDKIKEFANVLNVSTSYLTGWDEEEEQKYDDIELPPKFDKATRKWYEAVGELNFNEYEFQELVNYAKYIVSKRKEGGGK